MARGRPRRKYDVATKSTSAKIDGIVDNAPPMFTHSVGAIPGDGEKIKDAVASDAKKTYSCGCPVIAVDETRDKKKCIKHQVE